MIEEWTLRLNKYQRDNLLWLLNCVGYPAGINTVEPLNFANTGDWVGELAWMLAPTGGTSLQLGEPGDSSNISFSALRERVDCWLKERTGGGLPTAARVDKALRAIWHRYQNESNPDFRHEAEGVVKGFVYLGLLSLAEAEDWQMKLWDKCPGHQPDDDRKKCVYCSGRHKS